MKWSDILKVIQVPKETISTNIKRVPKPSPKEITEVEPPKKKDKPPRDKCKEKLAELYGFANNELKRFVDKELDPHFTVDADYGFGTALFGADIFVQTIPDIKSKKGKQRKGKGTRPYDKQPRKWKDTLSREAREMVKQPEVICSIEGDSFMPKTEEMACLLLHIIASTELMHSVGPSVNSRMNKFGNELGIWIFGDDLEQERERVFPGSPTRLSFNMKTGNIEIIESDFLYFNLTIQYNQVEGFEVGKIKGAGMRFLPGFQGLCNRVINKAKELERSL